jgi:hypothetical protein
MAIVIVPRVVRRRCVCVVGRRESPPRHRRDRRCRMSRRRRTKANRPAKKRAQRSTGTKAQIDQQRRRLLQADAVIICAQRAIDSQQAPPNEIRVGEALQVASDIINDAVAELEGVKSGAS